MGEEEAGVAVALHALGHLRVFGEILGDVGGDVGGLGEGADIDNGRAGEVGPLVAEPGLRDERGADEEVTVGPAGFRSLPDKEVLDRSGGPAGAGAVGKGVGRGARGEGEEGSYGDIAETVDQAAAEFVTAAGTRPRATGEGEDDDSVVIVGADDTPSAANAGGRRGQTTSTRGRERS